MVLAVYFTERSPFYTPTHQNDDRSWSIFLGDFLSDYLISGMALIPHEYCVRGVFMCGKAYFHGMAC